jgi:hypothetical protein
MDDDPFNLFSLILLDLLIYFDLLDLLDLLGSSLAQSLCARTLIRLCGRLTDQRPSSRISLPRTRRPSFNNQSHSSRRSGPSTIPSTRVSRKQSFSVTKAKSSCEARCLDQLDKLRKTLITIILDVSIV